MTNRVKIQTFKFSRIQLSLAPLKKPTPKAGPLPLMPPHFSATSVMSSSYGGSVWESNSPLVRIERSYEKTQPLQNNAKEYIGALIAHGLPTSFLHALFLSGSTI